jgi:hypothetical protein
VVSKNPKQRIESHQTSNGSSLLFYIETSIPYKIKTVLKAHFRYKEKNGEWFTLEDDDILGFLTLVKKIEENLLFILESSSLKKSNIKQTVPHYSGYINKEKSNPRDKSKGIILRKTSLT